MKREMYPRLTRLLERNRYTTWKIGFATLSMLSVTFAMTAATLDRLGLLAI